MTGGWVHFNEQFVSTGTAHCGSLQQLLRPLRSADAAVQGPVGGAAKRLQELLAEFPDHPVLAQVGDRPDNGVGLAAQLQSCINLLSGQNNEVWPVTLYQYVMLSLPSQGLALKLGFMAPA